MNTPAADYHLRRISALSDAGDWAGLVRHWLGHWYPPALEEAVAVGRRQQGRRRHGAELIAFLEALQARPVSNVMQLRLLADAENWEGLERHWPGYPGRRALEIEPPEVLVKEGSEEERATLQLVCLFPWTVLGKVAEGYTGEQREQTLRFVLPAAEQCCQLAANLCDWPLAAGSQFALATGFRAAGRLEEARQHLTEALRIRRHLEQEHPGVFLPAVAGMLRNLGSLLSALGQREGAQHHNEEALRCYRQLEQDQPGVFLSDVASTLNNLGQVLSDLGKKEASRQHYEEALQHYRRLNQDQPGRFLHDLTLTLNNLGLVLRELGHREDARQHLDEALQHVRRLEQDQPGVFLSEVALAHYNLGKVLGDLRQLEAARQHYEEALPHFRHLEQGRPGVFLPHLAKTLKSLGGVLTDLRQLQAARQHFDEALRHYRHLEQNRPSLFLDDVANTLTCLGLVLRNLRQLDAARQHLDEALWIYRRLEQDQPGVFLHEVAGTLDSLGLVLGDLQQPEAAREHYDEALRIYRRLEQEQPGLFLHDVGTTLNNLGAVLHDLKQPEAARQHLDEALRIRRRLEQEQPGLFLDEVSMTLNNLGNVLCDLWQLDTARQHYSEAVRHYRRLDQDRPGLFLHELAASLNNLGGVLCQSRHLDLARELFDEALPIYRRLAKEQPGVFLHAVATTLNNLGAVLYDLQQLDAARHNFDEALQYFRRLDQDQPGAYLANVVAILNNLGNLLTNLGQLEVARQYFHEAIQSSRQVAGVNPTAALFVEQGIWTNLARLFLFDVPNPTTSDRYQARDALREALRCAEQYRGRYLSPNLRHRAQVESLSAYELLIRTCIDIWDVSLDGNALREAFRTAELSRARNLMEMLTEEMLEPASTPPDVVAEFRALRKQLRDAQLLLSTEEGQSAVPSGGWPTPLPPEDHSAKSLPSRRHADLLHSVERPALSPERVAFLREEVEKLQHRQQEQLQRIRHHDADFDPDQPVVPIDCAAAQRLVPEDVPSAIVHYTLTGKRGLALVLTRDGIEVIPLPNLSSGEAFELAQRWYDTYYDDRPNFDAATPSLLEPIAERAVRPVMDHLAGRGLRRLILAPNRALHLFPLHACTLADGRYLADVCEVVYTPSLSILDRCVRRQRPLRRQLLLVENPTVDLPFTEVEGEQLRQRYPAHTSLYGSGATREQILKDAHRCHVLSYTGHAVFHPLEPLRSALILGDKNDETQWLSLRDIFCALHLPNNLLTVVNGCESGMLLPDRLDELVMLPTGFLYAGAACVLCTLWRVYDLSSALLVDRFHQEWLGERPDDPTSGRSIGAALREAQRWLRQDIQSGRQLQRELLPRLLDGLQDDVVRRKCQQQAAFIAEHFPDSPPFASPAHWAAFTAVGLAYPLHGATETTAGLA
jgi:tetratricopeptide (TPR) repeat protein